MKACVDADFLVALLVEDDVNHSEAEGKWLDVEKCVLSAMAALELACFFLKHGVSMDVLEQVMTDPKIEVEPITFYDLMFVLNHRESQPLRRRDHTLNV
ncbi:MAG: hypothetical protein NZ570_06640 [Candidatus Caldarchaeum sp.]|nr:hypothetical protein [Candidatus Caldarchaeum sp.]